MAASSTVAFMAGVTIGRRYVPPMPIDDGIVRHFGGEVPPELVKVVDVITVEPQKTYARWAPGCSGGRMFSPAEHDAWIRSLGR